MFGKLVEGGDTLKKLEGLGTATGAPTQRAVISECGEIIPS